MKNLKINELNNISGGWFWQEELVDKSNLLDKCNVKFVHRWFLSDYFMSTRELTADGLGYIWRYGDAEKAKKASRIYEEQTKGVNEIETMIERGRVRNKAKNFVHNYLLKQ